MALRVQYGGVGTNVRISGAASVCGMASPFLGMAGLPTPTPGPAWVAQILQKHHGVFNGYYRDK